MDFNFSASHVSSGGGSLASSKQQQGRPSLNVYLSASTAAPKKVGTPNNRVVQMILHDLDRIKRSKPRRRLQKCERLVYFIVQALRNRPLGEDDDGGNDGDDDGDVPHRTAPSSSSVRRERDHLLETTTIWALTHILRVDSRYTKEVMLGAGVPGLLFDIMSSHSLTGATRQYASELCFFLTSADEEFPQAGPLGQMGPVPTGHMLQQTHHNDRFPQGSYLAGRGAGGYAVGGGDDASFAGSELSSLADDRGRLPFVPYRISADNMARLDALFTEADKDIRASKDINVNESRRGGTAGRTSKPPRTELHHTTFPNTQGDGDASTRYSRHGLGRLDMLDDLDDRSISSSISSQSQSQDGGVYSIADRLSGLVESGSLRTLRPWQSQSTLEHTLAGSVARQDSLYSEDSRGGGGAKSRRLFHIRATPEIQPPPRRNGKPARSTTRGFLDRIVQQSNAHFALDARLGQATSSVGGDSQGSGFGWGGGGERAGREEADARTVHTGLPSLGSSLLSPRGSLLDSLSPRKDGGALTPRRVRLASLDKEHDMPPANRLLSPQQSRRPQPAEQPSPKGHARKSAAASPPLRLDLSLSDASTYSRSRLSVASATEPSDVPAFLASLDPLSLNVTRGLAAHILDGGPSASSSLALETNDDDVSIYSRSDDDDDGDGDFGDDAVAAAILAPGQTAEQWAAANAHLQQQDPEYYNTALGALEKAKQIKVRVLENTRVCV